MTDAEREAYWAEVQALREELEGLGACIYCNWHFEGERCDYHA